MKTPLYQIQVMTRSRHWQACTRWIKDEKMAWRQYRNWESIWPYELRLMVKRTFCTEERYSGRGKGDPRGDFGTKTFYVTERPENPESFDPRFWSWTPQHQIRYVLKQARERKIGSAHAFELIYYIAYSDEVQDWQGVRSVMGMVVDRRPIDLAETDLRAYGLDVKRIPLNRIEPN